MTYSNKLIADKFISKEAVGVSEYNTELLYKVIEKLYFLAKFNFNEPFQASFISKSKSYPRNC